MVVVPASRRGDILIVLGLMPGTGALTIRCITRLYHGDARWNHV
jgi:hypothetical protein